MAAVCYVNKLFKMVEFQDVRSSSRTVCVLELGCFHSGSCVAV